MSDRYTPIGDQVADTDTPTPNGAAQPGLPGNVVALTYVIDGHVHVLDAGTDPFPGMDERTARIGLALLEMAVDRGMRRVHDPDGVDLDPAELDGP